MIKKYIKRIINRNLINKLLSYKEYLISLFRVSKKIDILSDEIENIYIVENKRGHSFCGYFDVSPNNPYNDDEVLAGFIDKNAVCGKSPLKIVVANYVKNEITDITSTMAWNWQMGSRLRWSKKKGIIYYNDFCDKKYCCNIFDIDKKVIIDTIPHALYDISPDEKFGLSINFSRLQRLRPGYGYSNVKDHTSSIDAPSVDGLFYVDLKTKNSELLVSYDELSKLLPESDGNQCYINHISISPDNKNAMFFFIWKTDERPGWKATLWVINIKTKKLTCLEKKCQVSHYDWKNNNEILITGVKLDKSCCFYRLYNCSTGIYEELGNKNLCNDGHPVFSRCFNGFYSDTYPDDCYKQLFFKYDNGKFSPLMKLYHDPRMYGEKRCDLHPHYFSNQEYIALDTTYRKNKRQILIVRMKK